MLRRTAVVSLLVAGCSDPSLSPPATNDVNVQPPASSGESEDEDGARQNIAFTSNRDGDNEIYTMRLKGHRRAQESVPLRLTFNLGNERGPHWSPMAGESPFIARDRLTVIRTWRSTSWARMAAPRRD